MKKSILTLITITFFATTYGQTPADVQKIKASVKSYLHKILNNPASYQSASWSKPVKSYIDFSDTKKAKEIDKILESFTTGKDALQEKIWFAKRDANGDYTQDSTYKYYVNLQIEVNKSTDSLTTLRSSLEKNYKPTFAGYTIKHSFRARNKFNALVLQNYVFVISKTFRVESASDVEENERQRQDLQRRIDELTRGN